MLSCEQRALWEDGVLTMSVSVTLSSAAALDVLKRTMVDVTLSSEPGYQAD